jgi:3-dehydroquinate dehydratase-2
MHVLVIHGPNLNLLGRREPAVYGHVTLTEIDDRLRSRAAELGVALTCFQSNGEGAIVDRIQAMVLAPPGEDALLINPAAYTHTSVAVRDAIAAVGQPAWEVHLSDPDTREPFRRTSLVRDVCVGCTRGRGADGYLDALTDLVAHVRRGQED